MAITYWPFDSGAGLSVSTAQWSQMERAKGGGFGMPGVIRANNDLYDLQTSRGNNLRCSLGSSLVISVAAGRALILGHMINNDAAYGVNLTANTDATNARKDRIVAYVDFTSNLAGIKAVAGTPAASPQAPDLNRTSTEYQISLAVVTNGAASAGITLITDAREYVVLGSPPLVILRRKTDFGLATSGNLYKVLFGEAASNTEQGTDFWNTVTTPVRDPDNMHSTTGTDGNDTDSRINCVVPGWHDVWGVCRYASHATGERVSGISKVSAAGVTTSEDEMRSPANTSGATTQKVRQLIYMTTGDYVYMTAYQTSTGPLAMEGSDATGEVAGAGSRGTCFGARWVSP